MPSPDGIQALAEVGIDLPISTAANLWRYIVASTGIRIPCRRICPHHSSPWDAFCYSYFARGTNAVWWASRGYGGKTYMAALLADTVAKTQGTSTNIMGGSQSQTIKCVSYLHEWADDEGCPPGLVHETPRARRSLAG